MKLSKCTSLILSAALIFSMSVFPVQAANVEAVPDPADGATEVYLKPTQIDEDTYVYYDEDGDIVSTWKVVSDTEPTQVAAARSNTSYSWRLASGSIKKANTALDTTYGVSTVYMSVHMNPVGRTYVGHYMDGANKYYWMEPPAISNVIVTLEIGSSHPIYMALKNVSGSTITYTGEFGFDAI